MTADRSSEGQAPISWEALAAELSATREQAEPRGDADPGDLGRRRRGAGRAGRRAAGRGAGAAAAVAAGAGRRAAGAEDPTPADVPAGEPAPGGAGRGALELLAPEELQGGLEALLFVMDDPVDEETLAAALRCPAEQVRERPGRARRGLRPRRSGLTLRRVGEGWRLYTRDEHAPVVERYLVDGQRSRLTQAALETLAVIAYRQPVTRARISAIRGVGVDGVMRTLLTRGLVHEVGTDPDSGGGLYATTPLFLERLGLSSLADLPGAGAVPAGDRDDARRAPRQLSGSPVARRRRALRTNAADVAGEWTGSSSSTR